MSDPLTLSSARRQLQYADRVIAALLTQLDAAASELAQTGCTCVPTDRDHTASCQGQHRAKGYWQYANRIRRRAGIQTKEHR